MAKIKIIKKPWGEERLFAKSGDYAGKILIVRKGHRLSLQFHKKKDETLYLEEGLLKLTIGKNAKQLSNKMIISGESFRVLPNILHRIEALENCRLIEVSTPQIEDVIRVDDDYGRATKLKKGRK